MRNRLHQCSALACAILAISGATTSHAAVLTYTAANCTSFTLGGVAPDQTLDCVGGAGGSNPASLKLVDKNCSSFTLNGVAPNQILVCNVVASSAPTLLFAVSRKTHGTAGTYDLPLAGPPANVQPQ